MIGEAGALSQTAFPYAWMKYGYPPVAAYIASRASSVYAAPSSSAGTTSAASAAARSSRSMRE